MFLIPAPSNVAGTDTPEDELRAIEGTEPDAVTVVSKPDVPEGGTELTSGEGTALDS